MNEIFEKIGKTITETGKEVGKKTKKVGDVAKYNAKIIASEHSISNNYAVLGKYYYDNNKDAAAEEVAETVNSITASLDSIAEMKAIILSIKGAVKCQSCGCECPVENDFCGKCGTKLEKPEPVVEEECECCECEEVLEEDVPASDETAE